MIGQPEEIVIFPLEFPANLGGMLSTDASSDDCCRAIQAIQLGQRFFDIRMLNALNHHQSDNPPLTKRQLQIVRLVASGDTSYTIAEKLSISHRTVDNHRARIRERLGIHSTAQLVSLAQRYHWV